MQFEVEQKHAVADESHLFERLAERGVEVGPRVEQVDRYFAHPCRDFSKTDEALRIRTVGDKSFVTFKGPKIDTKTKTRHEIELPLDAGDRDGAKFGELLESLGFKAVAVVRKKRRKFDVDFNGKKVEGALDEVQHVGQFVELELIAEQSELDEAKRIVSALATELQLGTVERRSYLEMLLEKSVEARVELSFSELAHFAILRGPSLALVTARYQTPALPGVCVAVSVILKNPRQSRGLPIWR